MLDSTVLNSGNSGRILIEKIHGLILWAFPHQEPSGSTTVECSTFEKQRPKAQFI